MVAMKFILKIKKIKSCFKLVFLKKKVQNKETF